MAEQPLLKTDRVANTKGERSREHLLEAALRIIAFSGTEAVTYRCVAEEAGLTRGAVAYHFPSREQIILHAFRHYIETVDTKLSQIAAQFDDDSVEGVIELLVRYHQCEFRDPARVLAEYELILFAARNETVGREVRSWEHALIDRLESRLTRAGTDQPHQSAQLLLAVFRAFELDSLTGRDNNPDELRARLLALFPPKASKPRMTTSTGAKA